ncbi:aminopeptidase N [uncultured Corynebacterium sp.]|uniref:aminopeptidase N n=1 Tax=uncultured Corynebacterium sp. TaxID=159447 RepID=UPI0025FC542E|nr:aminopeptidase N [uncultured Corynebacterium sp.]
MSNPNSSSQTLSHAEAQARTAAVTLDNYRLHLDVSGAAAVDAATFPVTSAITLTTSEPDLFIDYLGRSVESVKVNGEERAIEFTGSRVLLHDLPTGSPITIEIAGTSAYSRSGQGLHRMVDTADGNVYLYSHLEPSDARRIFPCIDQPDLKAVFHTSITAPEGWAVLSNQPEVSRAAAGDAAVVTVDFHATPLLSTYLTSFAAGPYEHRSRQWRDIELRAFARASMIDYVDDEILEVTAAGMDFFDEAYGYPYPWGKYDSIFVPEYNLGAMENPGLVTFTEAYLFRSAATRAQHAGRTNTILHEMSHMWFGDLVTPQWWDDLWLKESFAEFMGADSSVEATQYTEAWANFAGTRKNWAYGQDQLPTTHPIKADIPDVDAARQNFDGITYAKGAAVLKQLVHYIGREKFYAGARDYFKAHAFAAATFDDLLTALKNHTERDLDAWSNAWLKTSGPDTLTPVLTVGESIEELGIRAESETTLRPHRLTVSLFGADLVRYAELDVDLPGQDYTVIEAARGLQTPALVVVNDGDHTYAKIRFDADSLAVIAEKLSDIDDELTRAVIWTNLWQATRDGELPVADYVDIVLRHAPGDSANIVATAFGNAQFAVKHYGDPAALPAFADRVWAALADAAPGSDTQLLLARTAIAVVAPERLRTLLNGGIDKLPLDPDIRWAILRNLARQDAVDVAELDAEKERDNTLTGAAAYLGARYAFPDTRAEGRQLALTPGAHSNDEVDHLLAAIEDSKNEWTEDFFASLEKVWAEHPIEIANRLVRGLYPEDDRAVSSANGALERVLLESRDNVARTLRVRKRNLAQ